MRHGMVLWRAYVAAGLLVTGAAVAQPSSNLGDLRADVVYSPLSLRIGSAVESSFETHYSGLNPSYLRVTGDWYPTGSRFGVAADLRLDAFVIKGQPLLPIPDTLSLRWPVFAPDLAVALASRFELNERLSLTAEAGLAYATQPALTFNSGSDGGLEYGLHWILGPQVALGGSYVASSLLTFGLRVASLPKAVAGGEGEGSWRSANGSRLTGALTVTAGGWALPGAELKLLGGYEFTAMGGTAETVRINQVAHRLFAGARLGFGGAARTLPIGPGFIRGRLLAADSGAPIPNATITVTPAKAVARTVTSDQNGEYRLEQIPPGPVVVEVTVAGYRVARQELEVTPGGELTASLKLERKTGPGTISGLARALNEDGSPGAPLVGVKLTGPNGATVTTGADGAFTLPGVGPGLVTVGARLNGYQDAEEVVSVPAEGQAELELTLAKAKQKTLASIRGRVRALSGRPIPATLKIPEAQVATRAGEDGRFVVRLPGGRYSVVFSAPGYVTQTKVVDVADGDQALFYVDLSPEER